MWHVLRPQSRWHQRGPLTGPTYGEHFERSAVPQAVCDGDGVLVAANPAFARLLDRPPNSLVGRSLPELSHRTDRGAADRALARLLRGETEATQAERILRRADGRPVPTLASATPVRERSGRPAGAVVLYQDLSALHGVARRRRQQEDFFLALAQRASDLAVVVDQDATVLFASPAVVGVLGHAIEDVIAKDVMDYVHPDDVDRALTVLADVVSAGGTEHTTIRLRDHDGAWHWMEVTTTNLLDTSVGGVVCNLRDVTDARRLESELRDAALHDALTGLPNRALLRDRLEHALARETRSTAALLVDLDRFRHVNEAHGHAVGDTLLTDAGHRLVAAVRPTDTVARFGGDQFLVVCEDVDDQAARAIAEDALGALRPPFPAPDGDVTLTASAGLALTPAPSGAALVRRAEVALLAAKADGRDRVTPYDAEAAALAERRFELGVELARSLAADELALHYQPVVGLHSGEVVGVEALCRWEHRLLGPVPPAHFVEVAEAEGLAATLDRWVVDRALREAAGLRAAGVLAPTAYVAVNVSARSLADPGLEEHVVRAADVAGLAPQDVVVEVTESATMADGAAAADVLGRLRRRGFRVAVDDFGTGHSSLAYLRRLPVSVLKVDRSFVGEIATDAHARAITASIVGLARTMGLTVVAEGVEAPEHAVVLRRLGADAAQGWLWSPAVSAAEAARSGALSRTYAVGAEP